MNAPLSDDEMQRMRQFHKSAKAYCNFIDSLAHGKPAELYEPLIRLLLALAHDALDLPRCGHGGKRDYVEQDLSADQRAAVSRMIDGVTADARRGLMARYDALETPDEEAKTRVFMLFTDLAETHSDVTDGIRRFELGTQDAIESALWDWRFGFESHWGDHLFRALTTLYEIRYQAYEC